VTILLADDNSSVLARVSRCLKKRNNYKGVAAISDGAVVVREYLRLRPDIVLLDISMGEFSGVEIAVSCEIEGAVPRSSFSPCTKTLIL
jgi:DNA-binding NarL/FixJ family response regulator